MVSGRMKSAVGLQKAPASSTAKTDSPTKSPSLPTRSSENKHLPQKGHSAGTNFSRSFGVYFPRASSQVQPRPPDVAELFCLVEELRERESRLKTELLERKLLKESAAIVPVLEKEISGKDMEIERARKKIECLEAENERLRVENEFLQRELSRQNLKYDAKIRFMQAELADIKIAVAERREESPSSSATPKFVDVASHFKSEVTAKCLRKCMTQIESQAAKNDEFAGVTEESFDGSPRNSEEIGESTSDGLMCLKSRVSRVPKPPPVPSASFLSSQSDDSSGNPSDRALVEISDIAAPPPRAKFLTPLSPLLRSKVVPPPPPPPPPARGLKKVPEKVRRVPEVVEFYHSLMRRDSGTRRDTGCSGDAAGVAMAKDMIGEIENRSAHLLAIKRDVETQGDFIGFLIKEVANAAFTNIEDVIPFVKWLDDELSYLVDERAVLKHFDWPEQKADALREAAFGYCDLKKMELEASSFHDDPRQPCIHALKKMQTLFEKLEHAVYNMLRMRESVTKRYEVFQIPINWMLDTGFVVQMKLASVKLSMKYMKRVLSELETVGGGGPEEEELIVQGVKFAFRVHQFAGGFDIETMKAFQELRDKARLS